MKLLIFFALSLVAISFLSFADAETSNVQIDLHYENGDRVPAYELFFIIYPDHQEPFRIVPTEIPAKLSLESGHQYNAELFVNDMFIEGFSIDLISKTSENFEITVPTPSGLLFSVYYDDGRTLVEDATISISSHTGFEWRNLKTAYDGKTYRTWVQSTTHESDYYVATVQLTQNIHYVVDEIRLNPGESKTLEINTHWPEQIDYIKVTSQDSDGNILKKSKNHFLQLYFDNELISEKKIAHFGKSTFDLLPIGEYELQLVEKYDDGFDVWATKKIILDGSIETFEIKKEIIPLSQEDSCKCISFRLDDIQDFWLTSQQQTVIEMFDSKNAGLTLGIIGSWNGDDQNNVNFVKSKLEQSNKFEIANHGWIHEDFTLLPYETQSELIVKSNQKITDTFNIKPTTFIPPLNAFNAETLEILENNGFTEISSSIHWEKTTYGDSLSHYPQKSATGVWDSEKQRFVGKNHQEIFEESLEFYKENGYAVIMMHPQDFSMYYEGVYSSNLNQYALNELELLIDLIQSSGLDIVPINQITFQN